MTKAANEYWDRVVPDTRHQQALWRAHSDAVNAEWLTRHLPDVSQRVLKTDLFDEALATGLHPLLASHAHTVVGIDIAVPTIRAARARHHTAAVANADVRSLPFSADAFDVVISNSTLDHFSSSAEIAMSLSELHRVLRRGGKLLLTLDNFANPIVALRNVLPFEVLHSLGIVPYRVGTTCTPRQLRQLLHTARFDQLEMGAILHCPRVFAVAGAAVVDRLGSARVSARYLRWLRSFEALAQRPTRFATGYYIAVVAQKR